MTTLKAVATLAIILSIMRTVKAFQSPSLLMSPMSSTSLYSSPGPFVESGPPQAPTNTKDADSTTTCTTSFVSRSMQVYIEDTDAYGVMYNANYLRAYERALHQIDLPPPPPPSEQQGRGALSDPAWLVIAATEHRFKGSPPLGGEFIIKGELLQRHNGADIEVWKCEMESAPPTASDDDQLDKDFKPTVYNTAVLTIASSEAAQSHIASPPFGLGDDGGSSMSNKGSIVRSTYEPFRDEFDAAIGHLHRMPLRNVLNLFERARSDYLGGPDALQKMQVEDGIVWVVTGVDDCELCNLHDNTNEEKTTIVGDDNKDNSEEGQQTIITRIPNVQCRAGEQVTVKTNFVAKRKGMVIECQQTLLVSTWDESLGACRNRRLAQGVVTIMALDAKSRRPTRKIPAWFLDKISSGDNGGN